MSGQTAAGASLSLSAAAPATYDVTGFAAITWTAIGEVTTIGDFGKTYNVSSYIPLSSRKATKLKGSYDNGELAVEMALINSNTGQALGKTALGSDSVYSVKVTLQNGDINYMTGLVTSFVTKVGGADDIVTASMNIALVGDMVEDI